MPKTRARKRQRRLKRKAVAPAYMAEKEGEEEEESGSEGDEELKEEQLEGLGGGAMALISRMNLEEEDGVRKSRKDLGHVSSSEDESSEKRRRRKGKRRTRESGSDEDPSWEGVRRGGEEEEDSEMHYLLPLKTRRGIVHQPAVPKPMEDIHVPTGGSSREVNLEETKEEEEEEAKEDDGMKKRKEQPVIKEVERLTTAALLARRQEKIEEKMATIAELASSLVEGPEENMSNVQKLLSLCAERDPEVAVTVRKMAMASLTTVFKDIAPSYHIRELTEAEKAVKVSKDVHKLRVFEEALLRGYQRYLTLLDQTVRAGLGEGAGEVKRKKEKKKPLDMLDDDQTLSQTSMQNLAEVALHCMCELVVSLPHFNFRNNILAAVVPRMTSRSLSGKVSQLCCETVERLFRDDVVGEISLEAVQLISKLVKSKSYNTKPTVLRTFLQLQLHSVDGPVGVKGGRGVGGGGQAARNKDVVGKGSQLTRKQRKRMKAELQLERDLRETEATESTEKKTKLQTEILKLVFATYFRILKNSRHSPLLQPVLEGLAKFAHLINVDFFSDLMSVLHSLAETGGLTNKECMLCVLTAFDILSGQGEALNIDPRQFYVQLYSALLQLDAVSSSEDVLLALDCMDKMLRKRRQVSLQRVFGFVKRMSTVSLQLPPGACLAVLSTIRKCMLAYSHCEQLLEPGAVASGVFRPDVPDPEMSQAGSSVLWELTVYSHHYNPSLCAYATHLLHGAPSQGRHALQPHLTKKTPSELLSSLSFSSLPLMARAPPPPPHPALKLARKKGHSCYYYSDNGINNDVILRAAQEANSQTT